jgi:hypothetical protein
MRPPLRLRHWRDVAADDGGAGSCPWPIPADPALAAAISRCRSVAGVTSALTDRVATRSTATTMTPRVPVIASPAANAEIIPLALWRAYEVSLRDVAGAAATGWQFEGFEPLLPREFEMSFPPMRPPHESMGITEGSTLTNMTRSLQPRTRPWATRDSRATLRTE